MISIMDSYQEIVNRQYSQLTEMVAKNGKFTMNSMKSIEKADLPASQKKRLLEDAMEAHEAYAHTLNDSLKALAETYSLSPVSFFPVRREHLLLMSNTSQYFNRD